MQQIRVRRLKTALLRWKQVPEKQRERMKTVLLRPYAPELNPQENIWDEIREEIFKKYFSLD